MDVEKIKFINEYNPAKGGSYVINESLNEYYNNKEGLTVDSFKDPENKEMDRKTGQEYICGFPVVYQVTSKSNIPSIFKNGFDRAFTGSKGGNMYGPGTYSTYKLCSTAENVKHGVYGDTFVKMLVLSKFKDFLIYDEAIAKKVFGGMWRMQDQLLHFFGEEDVEKMKRTGFYRSILSMHGRTSTEAVEIWRNLAKALGKRYKDQKDNENSDVYLIEHGVAGFIFYGGHDGFVCVVRDFKGLLPIAYSTDRGKTWKDDTFTQDTVDTIFYDVDGRTFYGKDVQDFQDTRNVATALNKRINDLIMVKTSPDGKYNFIDVNKKKISPLINFDVASPMRDNGLAYVEINNPKYLQVMDEPFQGYISKNGVHSDEDPEDYIPWDEFNEFLKENGIV